MTVTFETECLQKLKQLMDLWVVTYGQNFTLTRVTKEADRFKGTIEYLPENQGEVS